MTLRRAATVALLATAKPDQSRTFFRHALGLKLASEDGFAMVFETANGSLRIQKVDSLTPHPFTAFGWIVPSARRSVRQLMKRGVRFERYPFLQQDEDGVWLAPSGTRVAWFKDPDGNLLSISQPPRD